MQRLIHLDDPEARDPRVAGAKAAGLARARSAGLPALPGWVLPSGEGKHATRAGVEALERSGPAAACLAVADADLDPAVRSDLHEAGETLDGSAVVRSSTNRDGDPRWSGAFATYHDVGHSDLVAAVRGCWASAFTRDVTARRERLGVAPDDVRVAVLLQPWLTFDAGGTAALDADGRAVVTVGTGGPAPIVGGRRRGSVVEVSPDGDVVSGDAPAVLSSVLKLLREVAKRTGDAGIEWGAVGPDVFLLQAGGRPLPPVAPAEQAASAAPGRRSPRAERLARLANRYPAPLGERFVLPWAGLRPVPAAPPVRVADPVAALAELTEIAGGLVATAWGIDAGAGLREAAAVFRDALGSTPERAFDRLDALEPVDPHGAARVLGLAGGLGDLLVAQGRLPHREFVWRLSSEELAAAFGPGGPPPMRLGADRWEPFVHGVVAASGEARIGTAVAPGSGAGRLLVVAGPADLGRVPPRRVLVLSDPVPQVAPMLWGAAGLVTAGGNLAAHLFEVARSLGVPAVAGIDLTDMPSGVLVSVDGDAARVTVLHASGAIA